MSSQFEDVWSQLEPPIRRTLEIQGHDKFFIGDVVESAKRRCKGMPLEFFFDMPARLLDPSSPDAAELREAITERASEFMHELVGYLVSELLLLEIELHQLKRGHAIKEPERKVTLQ